MELSDIKREKDLHKLSFADLFYEIYDEPNGESIAMGIIRLIMPDFDDVYKEGRVEAAKYERFRKHLLDACFESLMYSHLNGGCFSYCLFHNQWIYDHEMRPIERLFNEGSFETVCDALYTEFAHAKNPEGEGRRWHSLIDALVEDEKRYEDFRENLERKINALATGALASSKIIKGLFLLPKLESDQELIVFFGNNFSASFNSADAYTGLLYASEYFDFDGEILSSLTSNFSEEEIKAAEIAETSRIAKEREEKAKREEERKRSEQYNNAIKAFDNGRYESAYKSFCELGDYREAKAKAAEAKVKWDEKTRIDRMRCAQYNIAIKAFDNGRYESAYKSFCELGDYREAKAKAAEAKVKWDEKTRIDRMRCAQYNIAIKAFDNGRYESAYKSFCELGDYREAKAKAAEAKVKWDEKTRIDRMRSEALIKLAGGKPSKPSSELYEERRAKSLEKEKQGMQQELSRLGFFKGKEKRLLLEKIEKKEAEIREAVLRAEKARKAANEQYNKARADYMKRVKSFIAMLKVGDEINLGSNGIWQGKPCPYTWRVQKIESDQVLIVLLHLLCTQYHDKEESVDWASCALRKKTIAEMLSDHFTKAEKSLLKKVSHDGVSDFIFAPSEQEINRYGLEIGRYGLEWLRGSTSDRGRAPIFDNGSVTTSDCTEEYFVTLLAWLDFS